MGPYNRAVTKRNKKLDPLALQVLNLTPAVPENVSSKVRLAPMWDGRGLASFWSIFVQGDEIYVANRNSVNTAKASLHTSDQWTFNVGSRRLKFEEPKPLSGSPWSFALRLSFLIDANTRAIRELNRIKDRVTLLATPPGYMLAAVVLIGDAGGDPHAPPPNDLQPGAVIMRATLRDTRPVIVVAAALPMQAVELTYMQAKRQLSPKWPNGAGPPAAELCVIHGKPNMISIIPLREEDWTGEVGTSSGKSGQPAVGEESATPKDDRGLLILLAEPRYSIPNGAA
jgi:hypothetical protein